MSGNIDAMDHGGQSGRVAAPRHSDPLAPLAASTEMDVLRRDRTCRRHASNEALKISDARSMARLAAWAILAVDALHCREPGAHARSPVIHDRSRIRGAIVAIRRHWWLGVLAAAVVCVVGSAAAGPARAASGGEPVGVHRLSGNVYEYDYLVPTGSDVHHRVGLHRVVQVENGRPVSAPNGVFLVHGDIWDFNAAFVGGNLPSESVAVYLASKGIDVWGVDLGWTLVPAGTTDLSFMQGWGLQRDVDDVETAMAFARGVRTLTGSSADKLALMAWSRGGWIGYALLNEESQKPDALRQVHAFIPVDNYFKVNDPKTRAAICSFEQTTDNDVENGIYGYDESVVAQLGTLAQTSPDEPSPIFGPPYTNRQASLTYGAAAFELGDIFTPFYHFVAGTFPDNDINQIPTGLDYTNLSRWNAFLSSGSPFEPSTLLRDTYAITCSPGPTGPFDDHLADVTVPVLYVGAGGGFGRAGLYSLTLLGSKDVSSHIVSFYPPAEAAFDFGHVDLFNARDAQQLVWTPIYDWLADHAPRPLRTAARIATRRGS